MIFLLLILFVMSIEGMRPKQSRPEFNFAQCFPAEARMIESLTDVAKWQKFTQENQQVLFNQMTFVRPPQDTQGNTMLHNMALNVLLINEELFRHNLLTVFLHYHWDLFTKNKADLSALQIAQRNSGSNSDFFIQCFVMAQKWDAVEKLLDNHQSCKEQLENYLIGLPLNAKNFRGFNALQLLMVEDRWRRCSKCELEERLRVILPYVDPDDKNPQGETPWQVVTKAWRRSDSDDTDKLDQIVKDELLKHNMSRVLESAKK